MAYNDNVDAVFARETNQTSNGDGGKKIWIWSAGGDSAYNNNDVYIGEKDAALLLCYFNFVVLNCSP